MSRNLSTVQILLPPMQTNSRVHLFFCLLACLWFVQLVASASGRPNILFVIADDWAYPHAGAYGDKTVRTPNFDKIARDGMLFTQAHSAAPSCTPSRAAILTGRPPHSLEEGASLHGFLPTKYETFPDTLEKNGYVVGYQQKGWGPGDFKAGGRQRNPAGPQFTSFPEFLKTVPADKPFSFWFGSFNPHRPYERDAGAKSGLTTNNVVVPAFWPDVPTVRTDILDYYHEVELFDGELGGLISALEQSGRAQNTIIVVTGDNGWPFPRGKANVYDAGSHQPLAVAWPGKTKAGTVNNDFVNLYDLAPTFLEIAGIKPSKQIFGRSIVPMLLGKKQGGRDKVFVERERHANVREGDLSYPARAVRTKDFLYIRNLRPDRWPAGDPKMWKAVGPFGDCDGSPSKELLLEKRDDPFYAPYFKLCFEKRPAEELYDLKKDPYEIKNIAADRAYAAQKKKLRAALDKWMKQTEDPRATTDDDRFDHYPYFGDGRGTRGVKAAKQVK